MFPTLKLLLTTLLLALGGGEERLVTEQRSVEWRRFLTAPSDGQERSMEELANLLREALEPEGAELFDLLEHGTLPAVEGEHAEMQLTSIHREVFLHALCAGDPEGARAMAAARAAAETSSAARTAALHVLARVGRAADLALLPQMVADDRTLHGAFTEAVTGILDRDRAAYGFLPRVFQELPGELHEPLVQAVGAAEHADGLKVLVDRLWVDPELDNLLLAQIGNLGERRTGPVEDSVLFPVRSFLTFGALPIRRQAVLTVGKLGDDDALPQLLELLDEEDAGLRKNVYWSLRRITGHVLREDPQRWRMWYADEERWWRDDAGRTLARLHSREAKDVAEAISELAMRKIRRHAVSTELEPLLQHPDVSIVRSACHALGLVGHPVAVEPLVGLLNHADESVRLAAHQALVEITGKNLPADPDAWAAATSRPR